MPGLPRAAPGSAPSVPARAVPRGLLAAPARPPSATAGPEPHPNPAARTGQPGRSPAKAAKPCSGSGAAAGRLRLGGLQGWKCRGTHRARLALGSAHSRSDSKVLTRLPCPPQRPFWGHAQRGLTRTQGENNSMYIQKCGSAKDAKSPVNPQKENSASQHNSTKPKVQAPLPRSRARRRPGASGQWHWEKHRGAAGEGRVFPVT